MQIKIRTLIEGLSYALDAAEKSTFSHSKHVAFMSVMIAKEMNLSEKVQEDIYYAALLHDIGASNTYLLEEHCRIGQEIVSGLPLNREIADYIYYHHELQNGEGPFGLMGEDILLPAQIICFSNTFEVQFGRSVRLHYDSFQRIRNWVEDNRRFFYASIVEAFQNMIHKEFVLLDNYAGEFSDILAKRIRTKEQILDFQGVRLFAKAFSRIIDNRSPFTFDHSTGIVELVDKIVTELGYEKEMQEKMHIAALLHDIGKLVVSNDIINKEGPLEPEERFEINKHTYYTRWILKQIEGFEDITEYASNHHEKLNGSGYPFHKKEEELLEPDRIMAICDIYQALTEDRPYRKKMSDEKVWSIIGNMVLERELDGTLVDAIRKILS